MSSVAKVFAAIGLTAIIVVLVVAALATGLFSIYVVLAGYSAIAASGSLLGAGVSWSGFLLGVVCTIIIAIVRGIVGAAAGEAR